MNDQNLEQPPAYPHVPTETTGTAPDSQKVCSEFQEHPGWRNNPDKRVGVTWDAWCSRCGFRLEDKPWANGHAIEGDGRRLAHVVGVLSLGGKTFVSQQSKIVCSKCCPAILQSGDD